MATGNPKCSGHLDRLCNKLVDQLSEEGSSTMFVVGLPFSGKHQAAELLERMLKEMGFSVVKVHAEKKCANTLQAIILQLCEVGVNVDGDSIHRMLKMDDSDEGRLTIYKRFMKRALENADASKIIVIVEEAENFGDMFENELIAHPPNSTSWIFLSSKPLKVILSQDSCGSTYTNLHFDSGHMFFLPLLTKSISSCDKKKEEIIKFLRHIETSEHDGPSTFWDAYCMEMTKAPIPEWIKRALDDYGLLSTAVMDLFRTDVEASPPPRGTVIDSSTLTIDAVVKIDVSSGDVTIGDGQLSTLNSKHLVILCMLSSGGNAPKDLIDKLQEFRKWYEVNKNANGCPRWVKQFDDRETQRKRFSGTPTEVNEDIVHVISELRKKHPRFTALFPPHKNIPVPAGAISVCNHHSISRELLKLLGLPPDVSNRIDK